ncbi:MAG: EamA family transporter [Kofleriaceae bacterium]|nr:EamA family transporter [Kofleriaceae bacterium]
MTLETAMVALPALAVLGWLGLANESQFSEGGIRQAALLVGAGVATATPLLFFSAAAQRISLSLLGVLQYIAPSLTFLLGVFVYGEAFGPERLVGFALIWLALAVFATDAVYSHRRATLASKAGVE